MISTTMFDNILILLFHLWAEVSFKNKFDQLIDASFRPFFSTFNMDRRTDQQAYFPIEMQFYISAMFVGFPDEIYEEKSSFSHFENNWLRTDRPKDGRTDRPSYRDARTHLKSRAEHVMKHTIMQSFH